MKTILLTLLAWCLVTLSWATSPIQCPIMGNPIPDDAPSVEYRGLLVKFCCTGCDETFLKDPERYLDTAAAKGQTVAAFLFDPVSHQRIENSEFSADYRGVRYLFESELNRQEFTDTPELFASTPAREVLKCPVMGNSIATHSAASGYADFEGVRYFFCCGGCDVKFLNEPAKYAKTVARAARPVLSSLKQDEAPTGRRIMPTCAGCAGEARLMSADGGLATRWTLSYRYVNEKRLVGARHRLSLDYAVNPHLSVGLERSGSDNSTHTIRTNGVFNTLRTSDGDTAILPRATWFITSEKPFHPSLVLGFASDRLSTLHGQAFFLTAAQSVPRSPLTPFVSVKTNTFDGRTVFPFGANVRIGHGYTLQAINDGDYTHWLLTKVGTRGTFSLLLAQSKSFGFAWSIGF